MSQHNWKLKFLQKESVNYSNYTHMVYVTLPCPYFTIYLHGKMNKYIYMYINTCNCTID